MFNRMYRYELYSIDGEILSDYTIRAAYAGSPPDIDKCHLATRDMIYTICQNLYKATREIDLEMHRWTTDHYDEAGRYADDVLHDWRIYGEPTHKSLFDTVSHTIQTIKTRFDKIPDRIIDFKTDLLADKNYVPKSIYPVTEPERYAIGEGHDCSKNIDPAFHPIVTHAINAQCSPMNLSTHKQHGCKNISELFLKHAKTNKPISYEINQAEKKKDIMDLIKQIKPKSAYIYEQHGRHDVLLYGKKINSASIFRAFDYVQNKHQTPIGCLVLNSLDLLNDEYGNDAKHIVMNGNLAYGNDLFIANVASTPRPAAISNDTILWHLDKYGFEMYATKYPKDIEYGIRPEYIIAGAFFTNEPRWYLSALPVMLCVDLDINLLMCLAREYGFAKILFGVLKEMEKNNCTRLEMLNFLQDWNIESLDVEKDTIRDIMKLYHDVILFDEKKPMLHIA